MEHNPDKETPSTLEDTFDYAALLMLAEELPANNQFKTLIISEDWRSVEELFDRVIDDIWYETIRAHDSIKISFKRKVRRLAPYVIRLLDDVPLVIWDGSLPLKRIEPTPAQTHGIIPKLVINTLINNYVAIWKFFSDAKRHISWNDTHIEFNGIKWGDAKGLTEAVVSEWWANKPPSRDLFKFIVKCLTINIYKKVNEENNTVKTLNFFYAAKDELESIGLPSEFTNWVRLPSLVGISPCQEALSEIGIEQTQCKFAVRYSGLMKIHDPTNTECHIFERSLGPFEVADFSPYNEDLPA